MSCSRVPCARVRTKCPENEQHCVASTIIISAEPTASLEDCGCTPSCCSFSFRSQLVVCALLLFVFVGQTYAHAYFMTRVSVVVVCRGLKRASAKTQSIILVKQVGFDQKCREKQRTKLQECDLCGFRVKCCTTYLDRRGASSFSSHFCQCCLGSD